jgi:hypothetical protein
MFMFMHRAANKRRCTVELMEYHPLESSVPVVIAIRCASHYCPKCIFCMASVG